MKLSYESIRWNGNLDLGFDIYEIGTTTLIAEIGHFKDFSSWDNLVSWLGVIPNVYNLWINSTQQNHSEIIRNSKVKSNIDSSVSSKKEK